MKEFQDWDDKLIQFAILVWNKYMHKFHISCCDADTIFALDDELQWRDVEESGRQSASGDMFGEASQARHGSLYGAFGAG